MPRLTTAQRNAMAALPLTAADEGLMVYDKDLNVTFLWDGTTWQSPAKTVSKYFITDPASIDTALTASTNSNQPHGYALSAIHKGTGDVAGFFLVDNAASNFPAVYGEQRGIGAAIMGAKWNTSTGSAGAFLSGNAANPNNALYAWSN